MKYYVFLLLTVLFWSGNYIAGRYISNEIHPMHLSFYRWFFVLLILFPYLIYRYENIIAILRKEYLILIVLGALGISGFNTFLYYGLQTTTATNALLINSATPIFIIILSALILKITITKLQLFGILLSTLGVIYIILKGDFLYLNIIEFTVGDFWIIASCIDWALYSVLLKYKPKDLNSFDFLGLTTFIGVIILAVVFFMQGNSFTFSFMDNQEVFYSLIYMVIFPSILSFYFWNISTVKLGANKAGQFAHLMPIFGAFLAYFFLDEKIFIYHLVGVIFIAIGIYLSVFYKHKKFL